MPRGNERYTLAPVVPQETRYNMPLVEKAIIWLFIYVFLG